MKEIILLIWVIFSFDCYSQIISERKLYKLNDTIYNWDGSRMDYVYGVMGGDTVYLNPYSPNLDPVSFSINHENLIEIKDTIKIQPIVPKVIPVIKEVFDDCIIKKSVITDSTIFHLFDLDHQPKFTGGIENLMKYIDQNFQYPITEGCAKGKIFVQFIIEKDGSIGAITIARGITEKLDNEAIRVIKSLPKWTPGRKNNKFVRSYYIIPISIWE